LSSFSSARQKLNVAKAIKDMTVRKQDKKYIVRLANFIRSLERSRDAEMMTREGNDL
jgi:hypothetical protein